MNYVRMLIFMCVACVLGVSPVWAVEMISCSMFTWDPNTETDLKGYRVYVIKDAVAMPFVKVMAPATMLSCDAAGVVEGSTYDVSVTAFDTSGNESIHSSPSLLIVFLDTTAPVITMLGITPVEVEVDTTYTDAGALANDNIDGDITSNIITVNPVDTTVVGTYTVLYDVMDSAGNPATQQTRVVTVVDTTAPMEPGRVCIDGLLTIDGAPQQMCNQ